MGQRRSEEKEESREQKAGKDRGESGTEDESWVSRTVRVAPSFVCSRLGVGWGEGGSLFLTCKLPTLGLKFWERPGQLSPRPAEGRKLPGELLLSPVKI